MERCVRLEHDTIPTFEVLKPSVLLKWYDGLVFKMLAWSVLRPLPQMLPCQIEKIGLLLSCYRTCGNGEGGDGNKQRVLLPFPLKCSSPVRFLNLLLRCSWFASRNHFFIFTDIRVQIFYLPWDISPKLFSPNQMLARLPGLPVWGHKLYMEQHGIYNCRQCGSIASSLPASYFSFFIVWEHVHMCCEGFGLLHKYSSPWWRTKFKWMEDLNFVAFP